MSQIRVAIIGGGLAGCTLANGLNKHRHLKFCVFESASAFQERGAHVALGPSAQRALGLIGTDVRAMLDDAQGVTANAVTVRIGEGPDNGAFCFEMGTEDDKVITVHRARFPEQLIKPIPADLLSVNKKLLGIDVRHDGYHPEYSLHFADGTVEVFDAVIGADGIHSTIRAHILGEDHPELEPVFSGFWDCRNLVPYSTAKELLGDRCNSPRHPRQDTWVGNKAFLLHNLIDHGERVSVVAAGMADEEFDCEAWKAPLMPEFLEKFYGSWGDFGRGYSKCLLAQPEPVIFSEWESRMAPTYYKDAVCMMGDAAHATSPWLGSGAAMAIEDALVLENLLGKVQEPKDIPTAFAAFDEVRRPRTQKVITMSRETGILFCGSHAEGGLDPQKLREIMPPKWRWIWDESMEDHVANANALFETRKSNKISARHADQMAITTLS